MGTTTTNRSQASPSTPSNQIGGICRREAAKIWNSTAESEARINLIKLLIKEGRGVRELEEVTLNLASKYKSQKFKNFSKESTGIDKKVTVPAMKIKLADEQCYLRELMRARKECRQEMARTLGEKSRQYKKVITELRTEARKVKKEITEKFNKKSEHLKGKYHKKQENQNERTVPADLAQYKDLIVFKKEEYDKLEPVKYKVKKIGQLELSEEEEKVLTLHPKFCIVDKLTRQEFEHEQETALAKLRMEISKEKENKDLDEQEVQENQEVEARGRQVYDPVEKIYDSRRRRVTDLKECSRVTLPKPLSTDEEATIEMRRKSQQEVFDKYIKENTDKKNEQKSNLTEVEQKGLKSLQKKITKGEIIVIKTDKSSKLAVTKEKEYIEMGSVHTDKDREINRQEKIEIEERLNGHNRPGHKSGALGTTTTTPAG